MEEEEEEEVRAPDPQPTSRIPAGPHPEVNGDLPGHPCPREGLLDTGESPEREPAAPRDSAEHAQSRRRG